jgi:hypothetical protein
LQVRGEIFTRGETNFLRGGNHEIKSRSSWNGIFLKGNNLHSENLFDMKAGSILGNMKEISDGS